MLLPKFSFYISETMPPHRRRQSDGDRRDSRRSSNGRQNYQGRNDNRYNQPAWNRRQTTDTPTYYHRDDVVVETKSGKCARDTVVIPMAFDDNVADMILDL